MTLILAPAAGVDSNRSRGTFRPRSYDRSHGGKASRGERCSRSDDRHRGERSPPPRRVSPRGAGRDRHQRRGPRHARPSSRSPSRRRRSQEAVRVPAQLQPRQSPYRKGSGRRHSVTSLDPRHSRSAGRRTSTPEREGFAMQAQPRGLEQSVSGGLASPREEPSVSRSRDRSFSSFSPVVAPPNQGAKISLPAPLSKPCLENSSAKDFEERARSRLAGLISGLEHVGSESAASRKSSARKALDPRVNQLGAADELELSPASSRSLPEVDRLAGNTDYMAGLTVVPKAAPALAAVPTAAAKVSDTKGKHRKRRRSSGSRERSASAGHSRSRRRRRGRKRRNNRSHSRSPHSHGLPAAPVTKAGSVGMGAPPTAFIGAAPGQFQQAHVPWQQALPAMSATAAHEEQLAKYNEYMAGLQNRQKESEYGNVPLPQDARKQLNGNLQDSPTCQTLQTFQSNPAGIDGAMPQAAQSGAAYPYGSYPFTAPAGSPPSSSVVEGQLPQTSDLYASGATRDPRVDPRNDPRGAPPPVPPPQDAQGSAAALVQVVSGPPQQPNMPWVPPGSMPPGMLLPGHPPQNLPAPGSLPPPMHYGPPPVHGHFAPPGPYGYMQSGHPAMAMPMHGHVPPPGMHPGMAPYGYHMLPPQQLPKELKKHDCGYALVFDEGRRSKSRNRSRRSMSRLAREARRAAGESSPQRAWTDKDWTAWEKERGDSSSRSQDSRRKQRGKRRRRGRRDGSEEKGKGKGKPGPPPKPDKFGETWEEPRSAKALQLIGELVPTVPWTYPLRDESRRSHMAYMPKVLNEEQCKHVFETIRDGTHWEQPEGRDGPIPRKTAWMTKKGCECTYRYGSTSVEPQEYPPWMIQLLTALMPYCGLTHAWPDCCNVNLYDNGDHSVGWHSDDERLFQGKFTDIRIISLSLGQSRKFEVRMNWPEEHEKTTAFKRVILGNGDLCTMEGMFQKHFIHRIPKEENISAPRINLTWRYIVKHSPKCPCDRERPAT